jgi:acyl-CoA synthetase (AMP-forming)/AMP-acid ligase II
MNWLTINNNTFGDDDISLVGKKAAQIYKQHNFTGTLTALCLKSPLEILALINMLRRQNGSVLLLPAETPLDTARAEAEKAGSALLVHSSLENSITLERKQSCFESSLYQFSSGTTGEPKLVVRTWTEVDEEIKNYNNALFGKDRTIENVILLVPVTHSFGLIAGVLTAIQRQAPVMILTDKNPRYLLAKIREKRESIIYTVPFLLHILTSLAKSSAAFHRIVSSGAVLSTELLATLQTCTGEIIQQYGTSETGCISFSRNPQVNNDIGYALDHLSVQIRDNSSTPGEILVRYGNKVSATRDLGIFSEKGSLQILGRIDDLINVSGRKVIPVEVEDVISRLAGVVDVAVYRINHPTWGEAVGASVVSNSGGTTAAEIRQWCTQNLPQYKVPFKIKFVDQIPKTETGKIKRKLIQIMENSK